MKRIYLSLALLAGVAAPSFAQDIDFQSFVILGDTQVDPFTDTADRMNDETAVLNRNHYFTPSSTVTGDSVYGMWGVYNNGPDVYESSAGATYFLSPFSRFLTENEFDSMKTVGSIPTTDTFGVSKYFWVNATAPANDVDVNQMAFGYSYSPVGSMTMLVDWDKTITDSVIEMVGPPHHTFVNGKNYGFFVRVYGIGGTSTTINFDANARNNFYMQKIQLTGTTGINSVAKEKQALNAYPNPATSSLNVKFNYAQNTTSAVFVRDITGRVVKFENYGIQTSGERIHNIDLSGLAAGTYTVELATGEVSATTKVIVK